MKKSFVLIFAIMIIFNFSNPVSVLACWAAPEPFEIFSEDETRVFMFMPDDDSISAAHAAVYETTDYGRRLIYEVKDLSSFAYEGSFYFSADMMHFARVFPGYDIPVFEVFSYGARTRIVNRSDFITDYASAENFTSIGPSYNVTWQVEDHSPENGTITISTTEGNIVILELATALFCSEDALPIAVTPVQYDALPEISTAPAPQPLNFHFVILALVGAAAAFVTFGILIFKRQ